MAATVGSSICVISRSSQKNQIKSGPSGIKSVSFLNEKTSFPSVTLALESKRLRLSCAAKQETVDKVCEIVRKQLAVPDGTVITGESNFVALGADSLDTVEIVMELEEEFGISMENESAEKIETVLDAADLIEKLMVESG